MTGAKGGGQGRGAGGTGICLCLACGHKMPHRPGTPCREERCPSCGKPLVREGSEHHAEYLKRKAGRQRDGS
jgi:predicted amidophosphoribosyltransferase